MQKTVGLFFCIIFTIVFTPLPFGDLVISGSEVIFDENLQDPAAGQGFQSTDIVKFSNVGIEVAFISPMGAEDSQDFGNASMSGRSDNVVIRAAAHDQITKTSTNNNPINKPTSPRVEPGTLFLFGIGVAGLAVMRLRKQ